MLNFIGHIQLRLDTKGRLLFPSIFKKNLTSEKSNIFVLKKDIFEDCLVLYPLPVWERESQKLQTALNPYNREHNRFLRKFFSDTAQISLDANNRLLLPRRMLDIVSIDRDIVLLGAGNKIELWNPEKLQQAEISQDEYISLAQKLLNDFSNNE